MLRSGLASILLVVGAAALLVPAPGLAQQNAGDPLAALDAAEDLIEGESWAAALKAYRALLADHPEDPRLLPHLERIESGLVLARFRATRRALKAEDVIGPGATKISPRSLTAEFRFDQPTGDLWTSRAGVHFLDVHLVPPFTLSLKATGLAGAGVRPSHFLLRNVDDTSRSISIRPGVFDSNDDPNAGSAAPPRVNVEAQIAQIVLGKGTTELASRFAMAYSFQSKMTLTVTDDRVTLKCEGQTLKAKASAGRFRLGIANSEATSLKIKARLEPSWASERFETAWRDALLDWADANHRRDRDLPDWMAAALESGVAAAGAGGGPLQLEAAAARHAASGATAPVRAAIEAGLDAVAGRRWGAAERALSTALEGATGDARLHAWRALARAQLRRYLPAAEDLGACADAPPSAVRTLARARVAIHRGDLADAETILGTAKEAGLLTDEGADLLDAVRAVRDGPGFEDPQGAVEGRFRVIGAMPPDACATFAQRLVTADGVVDLLAPPPDGGATQRIAYVFADGERFDALMERVAPPTRLAGAAYLSGVPTLYAREDAPDRQLRRALWWERLDGLVAEPPAWLAWGGAELLDDPDPAKASKGVAVDPRTFVPARDLMRAAADELRESAQLRAQARELVRFLVASTKPDHRALPADVLRALVAGQDWPDVVADGALSERLLAAARAFDTVY